MGWGRKQQMLTAGASAPLFEATDVERKSGSLAVRLKQGPVVLAFFKVSCPVCQFTFPFLERLSKTSGLQVIGISQDDIDTPNDDGLISLQGLSRIDEKPPDDVPTRMIIVRLDCPRPLAALALQALSRFRR